MSQIEQAAHDVIVAQERETTTAETLRAAQDGVAQVRARLVPLEQEWNAIATRRRQGDGRASDVGQAGVITMDRENLAELLVDAEAKSAAAQEAYRLVSTDLVAARHSLKQTEAETELAALVAHSSELLDKLADTMELAKSLAKAMEPGRVASAGAALQPCFPVIERAVLTIVEFGKLASIGQPYVSRLQWPTSAELRGALLKLQLHDGRFN